MELDVYKTLVRCCAFKARTLPSLIPADMKPPTVLLPAMACLLTVTMAQYQQPYQQPYNQGQYQTQYLNYNYNPNAYCISYFPPQSLSYMTPAVGNFLSTTPASALPPLFNALTGFTTMPNLLQAIQPIQPLAAGVQQLQNGFNTAFPQLLPQNQNILSGVGLVLHEKCIAIECIYSCSTASVK